MLLTMRMPIWILWSVLLGCLLSLQQIDTSARCSLLSSHLAELRSHVSELDAYDGLQEQY